MGNHNMVSFTIVLLIVLAVIAVVAICIRRNSVSSFNNLDPSVRLGAGGIAGPNYPVLQDEWYKRESFTLSKPNKDCKACNI